MPQQLHQFIDFEPHPDGLIVHLHADVDVANFPHVVQELVDIVHERQPARMLINLQSIRYLQSSALGRLATLALTMKHYGGHLQLCHLDEHLLEVIKWCRFDKVIEIFPTIAEACADWRGNRSARSTEDDVRNGPRDGWRSTHFVVGERLTDECVPWGSVSELSPEFPTQHTLHGRRMVIFPAEAEGFHRHAKSEEFLYVLRGRVEQWLETTKMSLSAGDACYVPLGAAHATFNVTDEPVEVLQVHVPPVTEQDRVNLTDTEPWRSIEIGNRK